MTRWERPCCNTQFGSSLFQVKASHAEVVFRHWDGFDRGVQSGMTAVELGWTADMQDFETFQAALGLKDPWFVAGSRFDAAAKRLDIDISFDKHALFACRPAGRWTARSTTQGR
jgi:hypothetical protein